ncbi:hypothetical protein GMA8713_04481 [Grimontia marina]|uniref:Uncharacterized protein n=1 Tax=Grimontia marina TaxID=646534 RepID=A0A128FI23_9GAMM|nr:hypothetical protein GMA8713_04481 [Grimontia marina]
MAYEGYSTFTASQDEGVLTVTFDFGSVNVQGQEMLSDLNGLAMRLERDRGCFPRGSETARFAGSA